MLASELLDRFEALSDGPRHPVAPRLVRVFEPSLRHHALDRGHTKSLPMDRMGHPATPRRVRAKNRPQKPLPRAHIPGNLR